jgi:hypothetical protein
LQRLLQPFLCEAIQQGQALDRNGSRKPENSHLTVGGDGCWRLVYTPWIDFRVLESTDLPWRTNMPHRVIVNADDFGLSACDNAVILGAFQAGVISSTTAMANMPAFEAACSMARHPLLEGRVGLHFNLTAGRPLSRRILTR